MLTDRLMRRPPDSCIPRQLVNDSETRLVSGDRGDGFVPILYFHCGEVDLNHVTIRITTGHDNPVTDVYHAVGD